MSLFQIELRTSGAATRQSAFRAWVDPASAGALESEIEVHLQRTEQCWSGAFLIHRQKSSSFFYRIGIVGRIGSCWSLSIRDVSRGLLLAEDSDYLSEPKTWILGSCGLRAEDARESASAQLPLAVPAAYASRRRVRPGS